MCLDTNNDFVDVKKIFQQIGIVTNEQDITAISTEHYV